MPLSNREKKLRHKLAHPERFKEQQRLQNKRWREANKERKAEIDKAYREANAETIKTKKANYYQKNILAIKEKKRESYLKSRDKVLARAKTYREINKEAVQAKTKEWCKNNPERLRYLSAKKEAIRRARKQGNATEAYDRDSIFKRDNGVCYLCFSEIDRELRHPHPYSFSIDHILPISKGGGDTPSNVKSAHLRCNMVKHDTVIDVLRNKYNIKGMNNMKVRIAS